jgi:hypothetical protein
MPKEGKSFICSSADWELVVDNAVNHEDAAALALQSQLESESERFSVGPMIAVTPIKKISSETIMIYSPKVLADIGMHKHAADLIKHIDQNNGN